MTESLEARLREMSERMLRPTFTDAAERAVQLTSTWESAHAWLHARADEAATLTTKLKACAEALNVMQAGEDGGYRPKASLYEIGGPDSTERAVEWDDSKAVALIANALAAIRTAPQEED